VLLQWRIIRSSPVALVCVLAVFPSCLSTVLIPSSFFFSTNYCAFKTFFRIPPLDSAVGEAQELSYFPPLLWFFFSSFPFWGLLVSRHTSLATKCHVRPATFHLLPSRSDSHAGKTYIFTFSDRPSSSRAFAGPSRGSAFPFPLSVEIELGGHMISRQPFPFGFPLSWHRFRSRPIWNPTWIGPSARAQWSTVSFSSFFCVIPPPRACSFTLEKVDVFSPLFIVF